MTGIGLKIKELRMERDLTMEMLVADMNAKYELDRKVSILVYILLRIIINESKEITRICAVSRINTGFLE